MIGLKGSAGGGRRASIGAMSRWVLATIVGGMCLCSTGCALAHVYRDKAGQWHFRDESTSGERMQGYSRPIDIDANPRRVNRLPPVDPMTL